MKKLISIILLSALVLSCDESVSTCEGCEFFEYEYTESVSLISGFDTTQVLVEQPYTDWESVQDLNEPEIIYSSQNSSDSTIVLRLTVEAGSGKEGYKADDVMTGFDGEKFIVWYGSSSRSYFMKQFQADSPRPPFFRIHKIEVLTPFEKEALVEFKIRY